MRDEAKHPWVKGDLTIPRSILRAVDDDALAAYARDEESCGLLTGPAGDPLLVDAIMVFENRANQLHALDPEAFPRTGRMYFDMHPLKVERAVSDGEKAGRPVKVLFHSHLDVGAYFSETDAAAAKGGGDEPSYDLAYLVTSVKAGIVAERNLFVWSPESKAFVPKALRVVEDG